jgi:eukaryotic-like serine/threonine-protein kinase
MKKFIAFMLGMALFTSAACAAEANQYTVGGTIVFGNYEQDNNPDNGKEPVEWIVLETDGKQAFLISKYCLDARPYNTDFVPMTWEKCTLRTWMNSAMMNELFTADEQASILRTHVVNENNPDYGTYGGLDTEDYLFLLSFDEAYRYFPTDLSRQAQPTAYAVARGAYLNADTGNTWWWLRTAGVRRIDACGVRQDGRVSGYGSRDVYRPSGTLRPVLWVTVGD